MNKSKAVSKRDILIFIFFTLSHFSSWGSVKYSQLNEDDQRIYDHHTSQCSGSGSYLFALIEGTSLSVVNEASDQVISAAFGDEYSLHTLIENGGLSQQIYDDLHSHGYYMALFDCFGEDEVSRNLYTIGFIGSDAVGKVSPLFIMRLTFKVSINVLSKLRIRTKKAISRILLTGGILSSASLLYDRYRPNTQEEDDVSEQLLLDSRREPDNIISNNNNFFKLLLEKNIAILDDKNSSVREVEEAKRKIKLLSAR